MTKLKIRRRIPLARLFFALTTAVVVAGCANQSERQAPKAVIVKAAQPDAKVIAHAEGFMLATTDIAAELAAGSHVIGTDAPEGMKGERAKGYRAGVACFQAVAKQEISKRGITPSSPNVHTAIKDVSLHANRVCAARGQMTLKRARGLTS